MDTLHEVPQSLDRRQVESDRAPRRTEDAVARREEQALHADERRRLAAVGLEVRDGELVRDEVKGRELERAEVLRAGEPRGRGGSVERVALVRLREAAALAHKDALDGAR